MTNESAQPVTQPATLPARATFIRLTNGKKRVTALVKEAKRVKYEVKENGGFSYVVTDPENANALVFRAVNVRPGMWAISYATAYFVENE